MISNNQIYPQKLIVTEIWTKTIYRKTRNFDYFAHVEKKIATKALLARKHGKKLFFQINV